MNIDNDNSYQKENLQQNSMSIGGETHAGNDITHQSRPDISHQSGSEIARGQGEPKPKPGDSYAFHQAPVAMGRAEVLSSSRSFWGGFWPQHEDSDEENSDVNRKHKKNRKHQENS